MSRSFKRVFYLFLHYYWYSRKVYSISRCLFWIKWLIRLWDFSPWQTHVLAFRRSGVDLSSIDFIWAERKLPALRSDSISIFDPDLAPSRWELLSPFQRRHSFFGTYAVAFSAIIFPDLLGRPFHWGRSALCFAILFWWAAACPIRMQRGTDRQECWSSSLASFF